MLNSENAAINSVPAESDAGPPTTKVSGERIPLLLRKRFFRKFFNFSQRSEPNNG